MKLLLFIALLLTGCAGTSPDRNHYVTNEQLRFRLGVYCQHKASKSLGKGPPYHAGEVYETCMHNFFYDMVPENLTRPDWRSK